MPQGLYGFVRVEEGPTELRAVGETSGKALKEKGKVGRADRDERRGGESLEADEGRPRGRVPFGGTLRGSVGGITLSLDVTDASVEEGEEDVEEEGEEEEGGLLVLLDVGVRPCGCWRRRGCGRWVWAVP